MGAPNRPRAAGCIRVSTQGQATEGESLSTQRKQIEAHAESKSWELVKRYEDAGVSGSKAENRPALNDLMIDCKNNGGFQYEIITKLSRFAGNARDFLNYSGDLKKLGVTVVSIQEGIDPTTHTGKLMQGLLALIAEWEREVIREQMSENKMVRWADHRCFIGKNLFNLAFSSSARPPLLGLLGSH